MKRCLKHAVTLSRGSIMNTGPVLSLKSAWLQWDASFPKIKTSQRHSIINLVKVRPNPDLYSASVTAMISAVSCYIKSRDNGTGCVTTTCWAKCNKNVFRSDIWFQNELLSWLRTRARFLVAWRSAVWTFSQVCNEMLKTVNPVGYCDATQ